MQDTQRKNVGRRALLKGSVVAATVATAMAAPAASTDKKKNVIATSKAALPIGPYSQAIRAGNFVFVAGEKGIDPKTGKMVPGGIVAETRQTLENIKAILTEAGASLDNAVSSTVHMTDLKDFQEMNKVYAEYFKKEPPGRTTVQVPALPAGAQVEITVIAVV